MNQKLTFSGFRYALIEGLENVNPNDFENVVIYTNLEKIIECKTDNEKIIINLLKIHFWDKKGIF